MNVFKFQKDKLKTHTQLFGQEGGGGLQQNILL